MVLVLDENNEIPTSTLYELGLLPTDEYREIMEKIEDGEEITMDTKSWSYEEICKKEFVLIPACDTYVKNEDGTFDYVAEDTQKMKELMEDALPMKITGIVRQKEDGTYSIGRAMGYTKALTDYLIDYTNESEVVKAQEDSPEVNVLNHLTFSPSDDAEKIDRREEAVEVLEQAAESGCEEAN